jgi:ankyrin repeat protein
MRLLLSLSYALSLASAATDGRIAEAVKRTDRAAVRNLITNKADVNSPLKDGSTALQWAVHNDDLETASLLIGAGANVKTTNRYGVTALSLACVNGSRPIVDLLLKAGADPNGALPGGETVLMTCARTGQVSAVKALLASGAVVDAKETERGQTALIWAASEGHAEVVQVLLEKGADPRQRLGSGFTPLLLAIREGQIAAVRVLLKAGANVNEVIEVPQTPGPRPISVRGGPRPGTSGLHLAVGNAHFELAAFLLEAGADPNAMGPGYAPLHMISNVRKPGGGDNNPSPRGSGTVTSLQMVKKLGQHGADLDARMNKRVNFGLTSLNTEGATAFLLAARTADAELMSLLASLGANPKISNADGATPLIVAAGLGTRSPGEDAGTESEVLEAVQLALELGNDINAVDKNGETAMHGAAYKNLPSVVEFLASKGANPSLWNQKNKQGWTPLTIAEGYRFGNYKPSPVTIAAFHRVMTAAGLPILQYTPANVGKNIEYAPPVRK